MSLINQKNIENRSSESIRTDQWKTAGNCRYCRREKYCRKACLKHKERKYAVVANALDMEMAAAYMKAVHREKAQEEQNDRKV